MKKYKVSFLAYDKKEHSFEFEAPNIYEAYFVFQEEVIEYFGAYTLLTDGIVSNLDELSLDQVSVFEKVVKSFNIEPCDPIRGSGGGQNFHGDGGVATLKFKVINISKKTKKCFYEGKYGYGEFYLRDLGDDEMEISVKDSDYAMSLIQAFTEAMLQ